MAEKTILFSAAMVRAILEESKTQTRRVVMPQFGLDAEPGEMCAETSEGWQTVGHSGGWWDGAESDASAAVKCPYGIPGDRLVVRETFFAYGRWETRFDAKEQRDAWHFVDMTTECDRAYQYAADSRVVPVETHRGALPGWWKRPAIFMPRAASRILLEVVSVRVEHIQVCSVDDAFAEGCPEDATWPIDWYRDLWNSLNAERGFGWDTNPWVWVVEFRRVHP